MGKIVTVELVVGAKVQFSQMLPAWMSNGWAFTQETPPFYREIFDEKASVEERDFDHKPSNTQTLNDFLCELDTLYESGKSVVVNLIHGELFAFVTWKQDSTCEFSLVGSSISLSNDKGKQKQWTDWNRVISLIAPPLNKHGVFIEAITLYEDFH